MFRDVQESLEGGLPNRRFRQEAEDIWQGMAACLERRPLLFRNRSVLLLQDEPNGSVLAQCFADHFCDLELLRFAAARPAPGTGRVMVLERGASGRLAEFLGPLKDMERLRAEADMIFGSPSVPLFRRFLERLVQEGERAPEGAPAAGTDAGYLACAMPALAVRPLSMLAAAANSRPALA